MVAVVGLVVTGRSVDDAAADRVAAALRAGGCDEVASAASTADGLAALPPADTVVVASARMPGLPAEVVARVLAAAPERADLARAVYAGVPGDPVALGADHRPAFAGALRTDEDGRAYAEEHDATHVECGDLYSGRGAR